MPTPTAISSTIPDLLPPSSTNAFTSTQTTSMPSISTSAHPNPVDTTSSPAVPTSSSTYTPFSPRPLPIPQPSTKNAMVTSGALAGIIIGSVLAFFLFIVLGIIIYRRVRGPSITELPITRTSSSSYCSSVRPIGGKAKSKAKPGREGSRLDKRTIGQPQGPEFGHWILNAPLPAFLRREKAKVEVAERRVLPKEEPPRRPRRPRSAEPLGRLSGMGRGMGYLN
jgi:hypothetical protein